MTFAHTAPTVNTTQTTTVAYGKSLAMKIQVMGAAVTRRHWPTGW